MDRRITKVVVLGGGSAGWMTAAYLGKALQGTATVTVLEAPTVPRIGVGEATIPNLQTAYFDYLGIPEDEWMRECNASFKAAIRFVNWRTAGDVEARGYGGRREDYFYHTFGILPTHDLVPLSHYWFQRHAAGETDVPFEYACFATPPLLDAKRAPRFLDGRRAASYAWHFDAQRVADYLCRFATSRLGVVHVQDEMVDVTRDERGFITALHTRGGRTLDGDLFVDCSGFRGLLINKVMREPFLDQSDYLLCDRAVAYAVPHDDAANGVEPYTSAIAMTAGWTWKIPMLTRFGTGYVYSSLFTSQDEATLEFCRLWGLDPETDFNHVRFRVGRNRRAWVKNCVSIGLASCFLEPLESTGLYFTYAAIYQLAKHFPDKNFDQILIDRFNQEIAEMFDDCRDFIQAHFYFSPRTDTPFWRANKELELSPAISEKIAMYRAGLPINPPIVPEEGTYYSNFEAELRNFWTNGSYYCVLAGLGVLPDHPLPALAHRPGSRASAEAVFASVRQRQRELLETLPTCYEYLLAFHGQRESR